MSERSLSENSEYDTMRLTVRYLKDGEALVLSRTTDHVYLEWGNETLKLTLGEAVNLGSLLMESSRRQGRIKP